MQDFEKLGKFYLGKTYDLANRTVIPELTLYDAKDLCTHAVCVGMTGSGKTGLCLSLLEEAAIDGIPAIAIDPKGDIGNLMLTFPELRPENFRPWVDPAEATRRGQTPDEYARATADLWKKGLADWGQDGDRIARFRDAADVKIYTPASNAGLPLTVLRSFSAPRPEIMQDSEAFRERIMASVSGLLALMQIDVDPLSSREHILLSNILDRTWREGRDLDMGGLIRAIQSPGFDKVGFMDLETFYPSGERFKLAMQLNNLLASPGFAAWMEGESLDIDRLLYSADGKPQLSIISIAHLSDSERMSFVTILLNEVVAWMRGQSGTSSLRAILYMDEVFGFFPPVANPPSKQPMLTLLKQARAFGLGCVLATQNPVDLDYKGLSNCGTWFLGRLQTERDKARVLDGLEGASATVGSAFDRQSMDQTLSALGSRVFLMNNVHDDAPIVFQTRWVLSYLRGPMSRDQIQALMEPAKLAALSAGVGRPRSSAVGVTSQKQGRPVIPPDVPEVFLPITDNPSDGDRLVYRPALIGIAKAHYIQSRADIDIYKDFALIQMIDADVPDDTWANSELWPQPELPDFESGPEPGAAFADLPSAMTQAKSYSKWSTALKNHIYRERPLVLRKCSTLDMTARPDETDGEFRVRLKHHAREERDLQVEKLRTRFAPKIASLQERVRKAEQRYEKEKSQQSQQWTQTAITIGTSLLGAMFGRKLGSVANATRVGTSVRQAGRAAKERGDVEHAQETVEKYMQDLTELETQFNDEVEMAQLALDPDAMEFEEESIRPRKSDLTVDRVSLVWLPWIIDSMGVADPAWE